MAALDVLQNFVVADRVHLLQLLHVTCRLDADERLAEGDWAEAAVEEEEAMLRVDAQEARHVQVVGQRRGQADDTDHALRRLHLDGRTDGTVQRYGALRVSDQPQEDNRLVELGIGGREGGRRRGREGGEKEEDGGRG